MTWSLISLCDEIKARIEKAISAGSLSCKDVFIGDFEQIRKLNDYPICVISVRDFTVIPETMKNGVSDDSNISVVYIVNKLSVEDNKLYKNSTSTGALYDLAKILNYLEKKTTDGTVDLSFNNKSYNLAKINVNFDYSQSEIIRIFININVKTAEYIRGAR